MIVSKTTNDFYPDLVASCGLANALKAALGEIGSALTVSSLDENMNFVVYARVELGARSSQVYIAAEKRLFLFDFWARGVLLAEGQTPDLQDMAKAIDRWVASTCTAAELAVAFGFIVVDDLAGVYERGDEVEVQWQTYIKEIGHPELVNFVAAAARRPALRQLFPFTSLNMFCFSRCTGYPFTRDTPFVRPMKGGGYEVVRPNGVVLGRGDAETAAELVVVNLPPGCGPAVPGTADDHGTIV